MTTVFTVGHSTRSFETFLELLRQAQVTMVIDVRRFPASRRHPQFKTDALAEALPAHGIGYRHIEALGGRRQPQPGSPNGLWKEAGFRGYADYARTPAFRAALDELEALASRHTCAVLCAEAVWWRCHRRIIADYLLTDGFDVRHILDAGKIEPAQRTPGAQIGPDGAVLYPPPPREGAVGDLFSDTVGGRHE